MFRTSVSYPSDVVNRNPNSKATVVTYDWSKGIDGVRAVSTLNFPLKIATIKEKYHGAFTRFPANRDVAQLPGDYFGITETIPPFDVQSWAGRIVSYDITNPFGANTFGPIQAVWTDPLEEPPLPVYVADDYIGEVDLNRMFPASNKRGTPIIYLVSMANYIAILTVLGQDILNIGTGTGRLVQGSRMTVDGRRFFVVPRKVKLDLDGRMARTAILTIPMFKPEHFPKGGTRAIPDPIEITGGINIVNYSGINYINGDTAIPADGPRVNVTRSNDITEFMMLRGNVLEEPEKISTWNGSVNGGLMIFVDRIEPLTSAQADDLFPEYSDDGRQNVYLMGHTQIALVGALHPGRGIICAAPHQFHVNTTLNTNEIAGIVIMNRIKWAEDIQTNSRITFGGGGKPTKKNYGRRKKRGRKGRSNGGGSGS